MAEREMSGKARVDLDRIGLAVGGLALLAALVAGDHLGRLVGLPLVTSLAMLWGVLAVLRTTAPEGGVERADRQLVALFPFLVAGILVRLWAGDPGSSMAVALRETALPEVLGLLLGIGVWLAAERWAKRARPDLHAAAAGWALALALFVAHVLRARPVTDGQASTLLTTGALLVFALVAQAVVARSWSPARWAGAPAALVVAGAQLLDGIVSTLAVRDPFGWLGGRHDESVALSALLIDLAGPVYPLVKWAIALVVVGVLDRDDGEGHWTNRFLVLLVATFLGIGPGLFSTLRVFA